MDELIERERLTDNVADTLFEGISLDDDFFEVKDNLVLLIPLPDKLLDFVELLNSLRDEEDFLDVADVSVLLDLGLGIALLDSSRVDDFVETTKDLELLEFSKKVLLALETLFEGLRVEDGVSEMREVLVLLEISLASALLKFSIVELLDFEVLLEDLGVEDVFSEVAEISVSLDV